MKTKMKTFTVAVTLICTFAHLPICTSAQVANGTGAGNCLSFDGVNDYVEKTNPVNLPAGGNARTIEAWINPSVDNPSAGIICYGDGFNASQEFCIEGGTHSVDGNNYLFTDAISAINNIIIVGSEIPPLNNESHIAFVLDGSDNWQYYLNGQFIKAGTFSIPINTVVTKLRIGQRSDSEQYNAPYTGTIDEVRIWNRALTETEIRDNMCKKLTGSESGLVGYWRFDEGSGNTVYDASGNGNNGTLY